MDLKYGCMGGGWCTKPATGTYGVSLWKFIQPGWIKFSQFIKFEVGDGTRVKFLLDVWCDDTSLKEESFPELYCIAQNKEALVSDHMKLMNGSIFSQ